MAWIISILCIVIIIFLYLKIRKKQEIDQKELNDYQKLINEEKEQHIRLEEQLNEQKKQYNNKKELLKEQEQQLLNVQEKYKKALEQYTELTSHNQEELDLFFNDQKNKRQQELDETFLLKQKEMEQNFNKWKQDSENEVSLMQAAADEVITNLSNETKFLQERYDNLIQPLKQYEKDRLSKTFYTIQTPEEYREDIEYLLTDVSSKIQHPDIINKLIWAEYVKPYIEETFKRAGIEDKSGIYKLTNIDSGKSYIGKSTNIKKRISDHFKSSIGIKAIADQFVHHAILKDGFWNWMIEVIIYCDKDKLNELEKYYINFFKTQEFGYNKTGGGEG